MGKETLHFWIEDMLPVLRLADEFSLFCTTTLRLSHCFDFRSNININDVLGNYSLTLIDTLDTLLVSYIQFLCLYATQCVSRVLLSYGSYRKSTIHRVCGVYYSMLPSG